MSKVDNQLARQIMASLGGKRQQEEVKVERGTVQLPPFIKVGDLATTCFSKEGRNRSCWIRRCYLGNQGQSICK
jgi:glycerol-3-phosphate dehydrogenase